MNIYYAEVHNSNSTNVLTDCTFPVMHLPPLPPDYLNYMKHIKYKSDHLSPH